MQTIGAYFQCYKNPRATYESLKSFRNYYPDSTVVLLSNNGYDYTNMAKYFNCIYIHDTNNLPFAYEIKDNSIHMSPYNKLYCNKEQFITNAKSFILRFINVFKLFQEEYIILLEDDVHVHNKINSSFIYDLNGWCPNSFQKRCIDKLSEKYTNLDVNKTYNYSGHGGSVYNKNSFLICLQNTEIIDDLLFNWENYNFGELCCDLFFSLLLTINDKKIGLYNEHSDFNGAIIQHKYNIWYNQDMPQELKYLVSID